MLAQKMLVLDAPGRGDGFGVHCLGEHGHLRYLLQHNRVVHCLGGVLPPGEGAVAAADDGGDVDGVDVPPPEGLHDDAAGVGLVVLVDLLLGQVPGAGDGAVEVVGVGGAVGGDVPASLGTAWGLWVWTMPPMSGKAL